MALLEGICANVGTELAKPLVNKAIEEAHYLCCHQSYVDDFDDQRKELSNVVDSVHEDLKDARDRSETRIDPEVQGWLDKADGLIQQDTKSKKKWFFGLCLNCYGQNQRSKELKVKTQVIKDLITRRSNLPPVARLAESLGIELYCSPDFMLFESRKLTFEQLQEALKDESNRMIGLQGMGGTGKTTMATQVGKELQQQKVFDKVIFTVVSNADQPADVIKIRGDIARQLKFELEEGKESEHAYKLLTRISTGGEKILIVLDDVWQKEINLPDFGIPLGKHEKGRCSVLITTRSLRVLRDMGCKMVIRLEPLSADDALNLFLFHSGKTGDDDSSNTDFKDVALHIVNECGRLPVAIVPLARALYSGSLEYWNNTLMKLQTFNPTSHDVHDDLIEAYKSLSLSYDNLKDPKAQKLFLLCSLFPEDFEIPVELLTRIAIGMGLCAEADKYCIARSQVSDIQHKLLDSCLLSKVATKPDELNFSEFLSKAVNKCVKMHDLIREVALSIAKGEIQVVMNSRSTLKENIQWSSWNIDGFPDRFDGGKLEFLLLMIKTEEDSIQVPDGLFEGAMKLRVLLLICTNDSQIPAPTLMKSTLPLQNIQTLLLSNWELGDISIIGILQSLETLELINCSITELPGEVAKLKKLRLMGLRCCIIESENPFKVIEECPILEELYYVQNEDILRSTDELDHIEPPTTLERYHIVDNKYISMGVDDSISRWFQPGYLSKIFSQATFKSLAARAEILVLKHDDEDIDLKVKELFRGPLPIELLKKLKVLKIQFCDYLEGTLFKGKLDLGNLRFIRLDSCPVTFLFHTSTAQSLKQLEKLKLTFCKQLKCIIADERSEEVEVLDDANQKGHGSNFNLKFLEVCDCDNLEFIFLIYFAENTPKLEKVRIERCEELEYIFGQYSNAEEGSYQIQNQVILPSLKELEIWDAPKFTGMSPAECCHEASSIVRTTQLGQDPSTSSATNVFSWAPICCIFPKSSVDKPAVFVSKDTVPDHSSSQTQMLKAKRGFNIAGCLMRSPLNPCYVTKMRISMCSDNLTSLFTLAVASSMSLLEELNVSNCNGLEHIVSAKEGDGDDHMNHNSIFPNLRNISVCGCELLEDVFPASHCTKLDHLEHIGVFEVPKLRYVFGKCSCQNHNVEILLPALTYLGLSNAPHLLNICTENCFLKALSLEYVDAGNVAQHVIRPFIDFRVGKLETQDLATRKVVEAQPENLTDLTLLNNETDKIYDFEGLQTEGPVKSRLNKLTLRNLPRLTDICVGTKNILSLQNLGELKISGCKKLKFIFSASILRSLPQLKLLEASECQELLQIIEDDTEENTLVSQQNCFPKLSEIRVEKCDKLKFLFSITACDILQNLKKLKIEEAPELMQVFGCKQGVSKELKHVFPKLSYLELDNLQSLESVCQGIDFQMVSQRDVSRCPKISLTSTNGGYDYMYYGAEAALSESMWCPPYISEEETNQIVEDTSKKRAPKTTEIEEIEEESDDQDDPKLINSFIPYQTNIISEENKSSQAPLIVPSQNEYPQNVELSGVGEDPSLIEKDNKPTSSTFPKSEVINQIVEDTSKRSPNMTKIHEIEEAIDEDGSKLHAFVTPDQTIISKSSKPSQAPCVIPYSQNESLRTRVQDDGTEIEDTTTANQTMDSKDAMVHEGSKNKSTTLGQQAPTQTTHDDSQNNIEVHDGEGSSLEKDNKATSSTSIKRVKEVTKSVVQEESANQEQNNGPLNLDTLIDKDAKNESTTKGLQAACTNIEVRVGESPSLEKDDKQTSSTYSEIDITHPGSSSSTKEHHKKKSMDDRETFGEDVTSKEAPCGRVDKQLQKVEIMANQINMDLKKEDDSKIPQEKDHDLIRLFQLMEKGADTGVHTHFISKIAAEEDDTKVAQAFADLEASFKMNINEIANSEENCHRLQSAIHFLSTHYFEDGASSHGLKPKIDSLQQKIQIVLSSFKQSSRTIHKFTELQGKEKCMMNEELPQRKEKVMALISEIDGTERYLSEAKQKEEKLKEHISRLQVELNNNEIEIKDCEIKLKSLKEKENKSFGDTMEFMMELENVKKERSEIEEDQIKARHELEKSSAEWSSCIADLKKSITTLGIYLKRKI